MSMEYPCVYFEKDGKCRKFSDDTVISYCVMGPCSEQKLSNADRIRAMSDEELAKIFTRYSYEAHAKWYGPDQKNYWSMSVYALEAWLDWLQQPAEEDA